MKCRTCKKEFHYCISCDYDMYYSTGYCSQKCYEESEEWPRFKEKLKKFYDSLNNNQKDMLFNLWDNGIFVDDKWEYTIDQIFKDPRDKDGEFIDEGN